jgi:hypothetical protein
VVRCRCGESVHKCSRPCQLLVLGDKYVINFGESWVGGFTGPCKLTPMCNSFNSRSSSADLKLFISLRFTLPVLF